MEANGEEQRRFILPAEHHKEEMESNNANQDAAQEKQPEIKRMDSFEIEKPLISSNDSDGDKKDSTTVDMMSPKKAEYDSRYLTLKQVDCVPLFSLLVQHHAHEEHHGSRRFIDSVLYAADGRSCHLLLLRRDGRHKRVVLSLADRCQRVHAAQRTLFS